MSSLQRMKFAFARGARIQRDYVACGYMSSGFVRTERDDGWRDVLPNALESYEPSELRLHPDDEHLQYGPLSSALRLEAIDGPVTQPPGRDGSYITDVHAAKYLFHLRFGLNYYGGGFGSPDEVEYRMLLLLGAELLADEGL